MRPFIRWILALALLPSTLSAAILPVAEEGGAAPSLVPRPSDRPVPYLVVTDRHLQGAFMPLVQARTRGGLRAAVVTLETIENDYPGGADLAERIRMLLRDAHANWGTQWVLLGGDASVVPMRRARLRTGAFLGDIDLPTDQYYACLDGSWNADGDGVWGELGNPWIGEPGDDVDMVPELFVGRAPVRAADEVAAFVRRTLDYERRLAAAEPRSALLAAEAFGTIDGAFSTERLRPALEADPSRRIERLYENAGAWPGSMQESRSSLLAALDGGFDLAVLVGAGAPGVIVAGDDYVDNVTAGDLLGLANAPLYPFVYAFSAFTTDPGAPLSIGTALMHARHGGAAVVLGSTNVQFVSTASIFMRRFFREALGPGPPPIGRALALTITAITPIFSDDFGRLTTQGNVLLGDPALRLDPSGAPIALAGRGRQLFPARGEAVRSGGRLTTGDAAEHAALADAADRIEGFALTAMDRDGQLGRAVLPVAASAGRDRQVESARARLEIPAPSPARSATTLRFELPRTAIGERYEIAIFDLLGRRMRSLAQGAATPGRFEIHWDLRSDEGVPVPDGIYFARLSLGGTPLVGRLLVLR